MPSKSSAPKRTGRRATAIQASHARCGKRKDKRRADQAEAEKRNRELRAQGKLTPWQRAELSRKERRAAEAAIAAIGKHS